MATARTARRAPARQEPVATSHFRGAAGLKRMQEEQERAEARREAAKNRVREPFRFFCGNGETREIVIIDDQPDFFRYEHNLQNPRTKRWDLYLPCIDSTANCPVCSVSERPSYFAMYLTIIDLTPYTNSEGEEIEWSKKLLVVKPAQQKKIMRLFERHGTLRGMVLEMTRDGEKSASIGNDIEFKEFMEDDELAEYVTEYEDKEGKVHEIIGDEPFDYEAIFPEMTEKQLRSYVGGSANAGNREDDDRALGRSSRRNRDDDSDGGDGETRRSARRSRSADSDSDADADDAPRSRRRAAREEPADDDAEPPRRTARRTADDDADADPPQRAARRVASRRGADADADPPFDPDDQDAETDNEPPRRGGATVASRRAALRRGG